MKTRISLLSLVLLLVLAMPAQAAIVTLEFASFDNGAALVNFDYNNGNGNVLRFRCVNNSPNALWLGVYLVDPVTGDETLLGERTAWPARHSHRTFPALPSSGIWWTVDWRWGIISSGRDTRPDYVGHGTR